jgi:hypothetical protein
MLKKQPNMNFLHQMESFNLNIVSFGGLSWCQRHISLSIVEIQRFLSLLSQSETKKIIKIKFCTKIKFEKY